MICSNIHLHYVILLVKFTTSTQIDQTKLTTGNDSLILYWAT